MDYFFIDKLVFFITVSRNIHFISVENVLEKTMITHCLPAFNNVNACYKARGFVIDTVHADDEFKSLKTPLLDKYNILCYK
jgi:N-dimethylarginine dimethylaminohydrolase